MINKIIQLLVLFFTLLSFNWVNAFVYNDYYSESINNFINSPSKIDLDSIENKTTRLCERIYLEATRRRDYTENELTLCSDIFQIKRQEELDYMFYMMYWRSIY